MTKNTLSKTTIIYPGTFDPITNGHIDIIERASRLFEKVIVAVALSDKKNTAFSFEERYKLATTVLTKWSNVEVLAFSGLLVDFAKQQNVFVVLRGLRAISDFEHEFQLAGLYQQLESRIETVFLMPAARHLYISSSIVREIASLGGDVSQLVPTQVKEALRTLYTTK